MAKRFTFHEICFTLNGLAGMSEHELEKLLGGFAADTLTREEKQALYSAALQDQQLFNALADEQALKELLSDPAARRRILASLQESNAAASTRTTGWLDTVIDWFKRPANLALAGGLATAVFAIVLGTRIYQDSVKQVAEPAATEQTRIAATPQPTPAPSPPTSELSRMKEGRSADQLAPSPPAVTGKRGKVPAETAIPPTAAPQEQDRTKSLSPVPAPAPPPGDTTAATPVTEPASKQSQVMPSEERRLDGKRDELEQAAGRGEELRDVPSAPVPQPTQPAAPLHPLAAAISPKSGSSARALFYGSSSEAPMQPDRREKVGAAEEASPGAGALADAPQKELKRADRSAALQGKPESAKKAATQPLGLRYSLIIAGPGGIDMEVDPTTPVGKDDAPRLTVETNEDGYLSVLYQEQTGKRTMLFPSSTAGSESAPAPAHIAHRRRFVIPLAGVFEDGPPAGELRLMIHFSRESQLDAGGRMSGTKSTPGLVTEHVDPSQPGAPQEHAVYIVNPDRGPTARILVDVALNIR